VITWISTLSQLVQDCGEQVTDLAKRLTYKKLEALLCLGSRLGFVNV